MLTKLFWGIINTYFMLTSSQSCLSSLTGVLSGYSGSIVGRTTQVSENSFSGSICGNTLYNGPSDQYQLILNNSSSTSLTNGVITVSLCYSITDFDTVLYLGYGCPSSIMQFNCFASNDDSSCSINTLFSEVTTPIHNNSIYILVTAWGNQYTSGNYKLSWNYNPITSTFSLSPIPVSITQTMTTDITSSPSPSVTGTSSLSQTSSPSPSVTGTSSLSQTSSHSPSSSSFSSDISIVSTSNTPIISETSSYYQSFLHVPSVTYPISESTTPSQSYFWPLIPKNISLTDGIEIAIQISRQLNTDNFAQIADILNTIGANLIISNMSIVFSTNAFIFVATPPTLATLNISQNITVKIPQLTPDIKAITIISWNSLTLSSINHSPILSISALNSNGKAQNIQNLSHPFIFTNILTSNRNASLEPRCIFWNTKTLKWSPEGCKILSYTNTSIECSCNHLTDFSARFEGILHENKNLFENAASIFSQDGLRQYAQFYIFTGSFFTLFLTIFIYLTYINSKKALEYARVIAKYNDISLIKLLSIDNDAFYIDRYFPNVKLHPKKLKETNIIHPYKGYSSIGRLFYLWRRRLFYQHTYLSVFWNFDPRTSKQLRSLSIFITIINTLFVTCLLYGFLHNNTAGPITITDSIVLTLLTSTINIPIITFFNKLISHAGVNEYNWRYPYLSRELALRHRIENIVASAKMDDLLDELALQLPHIIEPLNKILKSKDNLQLDKFEDLFNYARIHTIDRDVSNKVTKLLSTVPLQKIDTSTSKSFSVFLPVHTSFGWCVVIFGFLYLIWCFIYIFLFSSYKSDTNSIFYNFLSTELVSIFLIQPFIILITPFVGSVIESSISRIVSLCKGRYTETIENTKKTYSNMYFFADPDAKIGASTSLSISLSYLLFLRGIAETNSSSENRLNMEISVAPANAIVKSFEDATTKDLEISGINRESLIMCLYYVYKLSQLNE